MTIYYPEARINLSAVFDGFGGVDEPKVLPDIVPYSVNVHLNSYKEADTWEVVFDAKRFPFSPELLRSAAVEVFLYNKVSLVSPVVSVSGLFTSSDMNLDNLIVTGLVDQATLTEDNDGGKISLTGRDYTALMLDRQWDPTESGKGGRVPDGELDAVVQQLVDEATGAAHTGRTLQVVIFDDLGNRVVNNSNSFVPSVNGVNGTVTHNRLTIPKTTATKSRKKTRGVSVKADSNYWDVIYKLCMSYGYIVYVKGFEVHINKPHVLQNSARAQYRVTYGTNLEKLEVERKLSKEAVPQIRVRSMDPKTKTVLEGIYPAENDIDAQKKGKDKKGKGGGFLTAIGTKREEYKVFVVPDVKDIKVLESIAKTTYYTLARGEGVVRFSTPHLQDTENRDLLRMRAGDSVEIKWDAFKAETMLDTKNTREQKVTILLSLGYSYEVAALVADQYAKLDYFRQPFYVKEVNFTWDKDSGIKIDAEAMNFINPESDRFK